MSLKGDIVCHEEVKKRENFEMKNALFTSLPDKRIREVSRVFRSLVYWISRIG